MRDFELAALSAAIQQSDEQLLKMVQRELVTKRACVISALNVESLDAAARHAAATLRAWALRQIERPAPVSWHAERAFHRADPAPERGPDLWRLMTYTDDATYESYESTANVRSLLQEATAIELSL